MARHTTIRSHASPVDEDKFIAGVIEASAWARRNARLLIAVVAVAAFAALGALYYRSYRTRLEDKATAELDRIRQVAASGNPALANRDLETFLAKYDGTQAEAEARVLLARTALEQGKPQDAAKVAQPLAQDLDAPLGATGAFLLAASYEAQNDLKQSESTYLRIADKAPFEFQRRQALDAAATLRMQHGDAAGAAELYQKLLAMTPDSVPEHSIVEMRLAEAQAAAQTATRRPAGN
ncbi:MAG: tetratricopeptide repeat protein [Gemmatimonadetes bacterium]|nr:tetratricopeptide repeat protein [Gemmatimonadota bacterium]